MLGPRRALGKIFSKTVGYYTLKWIFLFSVICMYLVLIVCVLYVYANGLGVFFVVPMCFVYHTTLVLSQKYLYFVLHIKASKKYVLHLK